MNSYVKYKDIVLPNLKKNFLTEAEVFTELYANVSSIESYVARPTVGAYPKSVPRELLQKGYYFEDSDDVIFASYDILGREVSLTHKLGLALDIGRFYINDHSHGRQYGYRYGVSLHYDKWIVRLGQNHYDEFSEFVPTIRYTDKYGKHEYQIEYTRQNALFYVFRESVLDQQITTNHFSVSDSISWRNKTSLWANFELNAYSNNDTEITVQYDWKFFYDKMRNIDFSYGFALEGWYDSHSKQIKKLYYSPKFADTTIVRLDTEYRLSKYLNIRAFAGAGYSFYDKYVPYKYGIHLFSNEIDSLLYDMGCLYSNSLRNSSSANYNYIECNFLLGYTW